MKAAVFLEPGKIALQKVPTPEPSAEEILVKVDACAICGTDLRIYQYGHAKVKPPHIIGHEVAGIIEQVGAGVENYSPRDKVTIVTEVGCEICDYCCERRQNMCSQRKAMGYYYPGGFAEYIHCYTGSRSTLR